jgi:hypothetical protein
MMAAIEDIDEMRKLCLKRGQEIDLLHTKNANLQKALRKKVECASCSFAVDGGASGYHTCDDAGARALLSALSDTELEKHLDNNESLIIHALKLAADVPCPNRKWPDGPSSPYRDCAECFACQARYAIQKYKLINIGPTDTK